MKNERCVFSMTDRANSGDSGRRLQTVWSLIAFASTARVIVSDRFSDAVCLSCAFLSISSVPSRAGAAGLR